VTALAGFIVVASAPARPCKDQKGSEGSWISRGYPEDSRLARTSLNRQRPAVPTAPSTSSNLLPWSHRHLQALGNAAPFYFPTVPSSTCFCSLDCSVPAPPPRSHPPPHTCRTSSCKQLASSPNHERPGITCYLEPPYRTKHHAYSTCLECHCIHTCSSPLPRPTWLSSCHRHRQVDVKPPDAPS
jgi:hypothetical protein